MGRSIGTGERGDHPHPFPPPGHPLLFGRNGSMGRVWVGGERGFTLLELMSIVTIVGILVTMAVPSYQTSVVKAREAVLIRDLFTVRDLLDQHRGDKGKYPDSLNDLVTAGYLRAIPMDPFTRSASTWQEIIEATEGGVFDIHSGSDLVGTNGVPYNQW
jgi:general secretion pathway protein G